MRRYGGGPLNLEDNPLGKRELQRFPFTDLQQVKHILILCHRHADVDAYSAAYGLTQLFKAAAPTSKVHVAAPEGLSLPARRLQERYPIGIVEISSKIEPDLLIIVDTGHAALLKEWTHLLQTTTSKKILVDHHPSDPHLSSMIDHSLIDESASSTSEIIYRIAQAKGLAMNKDWAQVLLTGILTDSQHLSTAEGATIEAVLGLYRLGATISKSRELLAFKRDPSEIIARLKAAQRLQIYRLGRWLLATTRVNSFQASAARALVELGADVAFAVGESEGEVRGCFRSNQSFQEKTGLHLGNDVAKPAAELLGGAGGGHPAAASLTTEEAVEKTLSTIITLLSDRLCEEVKELH